MKLKSVLDTLDGLDEALKPFYTEKDGAFTLNIEGVADHPEAKGLKTALDKERNKNKDLQTKLDNAPVVPDDFSVEEWNRLKDGGAGNVDQRLTDQRTRLTTEKDAAVKKEKDRADLYEKMVRTMATENAINAAMAENKITDPDFQELVRAKFIGQSKVDFENDMPVVTIGNLPVSDQIKAYASSESGKKVVTAPNNGGGGAGGNNGGGAVGYDKMSFTDLTEKAQSGDTAAKNQLDRLTKIDKPKTR